MAKLTNIRERVQQPYRDALIRTGGLVPGSLAESTALFTQGTTGGTSGRGIGETNLISGNTLSNDSSMIILALRVFTWFRPSILRETNVAGLVTKNGDIGVFANGSGQPGAGNALGDANDQYRLYMQTSSDLFWTFGVGGKPSISSMPTSYFPYGGGLWGSIGNQSEFALYNNGDPSQTSILKLARAILLTPRQEVICNAQGIRLPDGNQAGLFLTTQGSRNMLSVIDNLNACDAVQKNVNFSFDGLLSRDVQLSCQWAICLRADAHSTDSLKGSLTPLETEGERAGSSAFLHPTRGLVTPRRASIDCAPELTRSSLRLDTRPSEKWAGAHHRRLKRGPLAAMKPYRNDFYPTLAGCPRERGGPTGGDQRPESSHSGGQKAARNPARETPPPCRCPFSSPRTCTR